MVYDKLKTPFLGYPKSWYKSYTIKRNFFLTGTIPVFCKFYMFKFICFSDLLLLLARYTTKHLKENLLKVSALFIFEDLWSLYLVTYFLTYRRTGGKYRLAPLVKISSCLSLFLNESKLT